MAFPVHTAAHALSHTLALTFSSLEDAFPRPPRFTQILPAFKAPLAHSSELLSSELIQGGKGDHQCACEPLKAAEHSGPQRQLGRDPQERNIYEVEE